MIVCKISQAHGYGNGELSKAGYNFNGSHPGSGADLGGAL